MYCENALFNDLERERMALDGIDRMLLDAVRARIRCCERIAVIKRRDGVPMMQPQRIGVVQRRAAAYAAAHGLDEGFLRRLYDLVIAETCRVEDVLIDAA
jgi:4-amino-4-deoxychorismate mutase